MARKRRYAQVGIGSRAEMFYDAIAGTYRDTAEIVSLCDVNQSRMNLANRILSERYAAQPVPTYGIDAFDTMISREKPDVLIVTSIDRTHHSYIIRGLERGCEIITEKPMTIDEEKCRAIFDAIARTGGTVRVCFNYRYAPHFTKLRELMMHEVISKAFSVHFEWLLDTRHGADYFRRWHRDKRNSGGLLVHKATHHFDLVNFWLGSRPRTVFAMGDLRFYGRENAESRGITKFYSRARGSPQAQSDPFALHLDKDPSLKDMYLEAEWEDGYHRDQSVFGDGISIEDTMGVMVRYANGAIMTYSLNAYMPREGYRVAINGSKGRIQLSVGEQSYISAVGRSDERGKVTSRTLSVHPMLGESYEVPLEQSEGGHGGADPHLLYDLFGPPHPDPFGRAANHIDGASSVLTGIAANKSIRTGLPVEVDSLLRY